MRTPELPPEAYNFSAQEIAALCEFSNYKTLGSALITLIEPCPVDGFDPTYGPDGLRLEIDQRDCVGLHIDHVQGLQQIRHDLVQAATYMQLHPIYSTYEVAVGTTYRQMASLVVRAFGFRPITPTKLEPEFRLRLSDFYDALPISHKSELEPVTVYMPVREIIERFGAKRFGTDALLLSQRIAAGEILSHNNAGTASPEQDPILHAIQNTIATMGNHEPNA